MEAQVKTKEQREAEEAAIKRQKEEMMVKIHSSSIFLFGGGGLYICSIEETTLCKKQVL